MKFQVLWDGCLVKLKKRNGCLGNFVKTDFGPTLCEQPHSKDKNRMTFPIGGSVQRFLSINQYLNS